MTKSSLKIINVVFAVFLLAWPLVVFMSAFLWDHPPDAGIELVVLEYATVTVFIYPLIFAITLVVSNMLWKRGKTKSALSVALLPVVTGLPWMTLFAAVSIALSLRGT